MNSKYVLALVVTVGQLAAWQQAPAKVADDTVVLKAGDFTLTKKQYETIAPGFGQPAGAPLTGAVDSAQSAAVVTKLLALVSEAQRRHIDQEAAMKAIIQVRTYTILANALLLRLVDEMKKDEAGSRAYWAAEKHHFVEVHARQILVRYRGVKLADKAARGVQRSEAEAAALAKSLYAKVKGGADFAAVAKASSDDETTSASGGDLNYFMRGAMTGGFEEMAFKLPKGTVSEPFKTEFGYHIIEVLDHKPLPFEKVRAAIENQRAREKYEEIGKRGVKINEAYFK